MTTGLVLTACGSDDGGSSGGGDGSDAATATSAEDFGGMDALIEAAQEEGTLNVIALPPDWANYGEMLETFSEKYDIEINSASPDGSSQDELNAVESQRGQDRAPDVLDLGTAFARQAQAQGLLAPYKVETWDEIPENQKDADGHWFNDYGGFISIGCNASVVETCPTTFAELLDPQYAGQVALNGNPTQAAAAFSGVWAASLANGGSLDDIGPGIDFFTQIKDAGNFNPVEITPRPSRAARPRSPSTGTTSTPPSPRSSPSRASSGRSPSPPTECSAATTARRSARSPRTRRRPGCGRSSCTATTARTSGWRAAPVRSGCRTWKRRGPPTPRPWRRCPRSRATSSSRPTSSRRRRRPSWPSAGTRRSPADHRIAGRGRAGPSQEGPARPRARRPRRAAVLPVRRDVPAAADRRARRRGVPRDRPGHVRGELVDRLRPGGHRGPYGRSYLGSLQLSAITAVLGAVLGLALAVAVLRARRGRLLRRLVLTASGVLANFGGIPLAFAFIATIGTSGVVTALLTDTLGLGLGGFSLYSMTGLALVYLYFLIPLMVLTIVPALEALRPQWREAADNLGATGWQYWRYVGGPVLAPPVIGATMLLFASAFAAYATARALVGSSIPLVTLQIADALSSNVVVGSENLGKALALGMVLLIGLVMIFYAWVQRRTQRWLS
ncbi:extracellular solute-binding protein [Blastococcus brunescens]|uniref:Extracellular solute-binding protein n=1 Tax=Blastococcus brunescens TaxID=1564165 RepID=A0ABZ1AX11_9ACTN|nr:extracellular solute-binding protein [Blastococcus sp. BMG 8361]WRL62657.1 extracellular solute-binding protein [Blastococcus sp. BMG 8361]